MSAVYGKHSISLTSMYEWQKKFHEGRTSLQDDLHLGQEHRAIMPEVIAWIDGLIWENKQHSQQWKHLNSPPT